MRLQAIATLALAAVASAALATAAPSPVTTTPAPPAPTSAPAQLPARIDIAAFVGDEFPNTAHRSLKERFLMDCPTIPGTLDEVANEPISIGSTYSCFSIVVVWCGNNALTGFHLVKKGERIRLYTAAHVINFWNRDLNMSPAGSQPDFSRCTLQLGFDGPRLATRISTPVYRSQAVATIVAGKQAEGLSSIYHASINDVAWFDVEPLNAERNALLNVAIPVFTGDPTKASRLCVAGHNGPSGSIIFRCMNNNQKQSPPTIFVDSNNVINTRLPMFEGMSGGPVVATIDKKAVAIGLVQGGVDSGKLSPILDSQGALHLLEAKMTNLNWAMSHDW